TSQGTSDSPRARAQARRRWPDRTSQPDRWRRTTKGTRTPCARMLSRRSPISASGAPERDRLKGVGDRWEVGVGRTPGAEGEGGWGRGWGGWGGGGLGGGGGWAGEAGVGGEARRGPGACPEQSGRGRSSRADFGIGAAGVVCTMRGKARAVRPGRVRGARAG